MLGTPCTIFYQDLYFLGIIKWVSLATVYSNTMYWPVSAGWGGIVNMLSKYLKSYISKNHLNAFKSNLFECIHIKFI